MVQKQKLSLSEQEIKKLAVLLENQVKKEKREKTYASVKEVLSFLAQGSIIAFSFVAPNAPRLLKLFRKNYDPNLWKKYNPSYLKRTIKRLEEQKLVEIDQKNDEQIVKITQAGKQKTLKYAIGSLMVQTPKTWDGKWRIIIYDVPENRRNFRDTIRDFLKDLGFLEIQRSVYLLPYPCQEQIEFLRSFYGLGENIKIIWAYKIENEKAYREYFGI